MSERTNWYVAENKRLRARVEALTAAIEHVVNNSPGTPQSVKEYLRREAGVPVEKPNNLEIEMEVLRMEKEIRSEETSSSLEETQDEQDTE